MGTIQAATPTFPAAIAARASEGPGAPSGCARARRTRAGTRRARAARHRHDGLPGERRRRLRAWAVRAGPRRRLGGVAGRPLARTRRRPLELELPGADADHVRELCARAVGRAAAAAGGARGHDRGGVRDPAARTPADLPGRLRIPRIRAPGGSARARSVYAFRRRSSHRPGLPLHRMAISALALRPAVHARELCARAAGTRRRPVGVQGDRGPLEPRRGRAHRARCRAPRPLPQLGARVPRSEPRTAGAGGRRSAQRHAAAARAGARAGVDRGREQALARSRGCARRRRGHQGHRWARASVPGARAVADARAPSRRARRRRRAAGGRARRRARLRRARARLPECRR